MVECSSDVKELMGSILGWAIPKNFKMVFCASFLAPSIKRLVQRNMVDLSIVDCNM